MFLAYTCIYKYMKYIPDSEARDSEATRKLGLGSLSLARSEFFKHMGVQRLSCQLEIGPRPSLLRLPARPSALISPSPPWGRCHRQRRCCRRRRCARRRLGRHSLYYSRRCHSATAAGAAGVATADAGAAGDAAATSIGFGVTTAT